MSKARYLIGVDVGGTFTDLVLYNAAGAARGPVEGLDPQEVKDKL